LPFDARSNSTLHYAADGHTILNELSDHPVGVGGCKISLDKNFKRVTAVLFLDYLVDPILEHVKGPKVIEDPLSDPIWRFGVKGGHAGYLPEEWGIMRVVAHVCEWRGAVQHPRAIDRQRNHGISFDHLLGSDE
jgi:hypothetical protein